MPIYSYLQLTAASLGYLSPLIKDDDAMVYHEVYLADCSLSRELSNCTIITPSMWANATARREWLFHQCAKIGVRQTAEEINPASLLSSTTVCSENWPGLDKRFTGQLGEFLNAHAITADLP